jgi:hypothetical protein
MNFAKQNLSFLIAALLALALLVPVQAGIFQDPAPLLSWQDWRLIGSCGGVDYLAAISADDGRNDFELKIKIDNKNKHVVQTRLSAIIQSENGEKKYRENVGLGRLNGGRAAEACSTTPGLCFGVLFPSAVSQKQPTRIAKLILTNIDVANIDAPPANASPAVYLDPYRDYPHTKCRDLSITFQIDSGPRFISLTDQCVKGLPKWTKPDCDDAVDEILKAFKQTTSAKDQDCIKQWRDYQKCYEIYAFESNPLQRPTCERPVCKFQINGNLI